MEQSVSQYNEKTDSWLQNVCFKKEFSSRDNLIISGLCSAPVQLCSGTQSNDVCVRALFFFFFVTSLLQDASVS